MDFKAGSNLRMTSIADSSQVSLQNHTQTVGKKLTQILGEGQKTDVILGEYLVSGPLSEIGFDETGLLIFENNITSLKAWLEGLAREVQKIIVTMGTNPNVAKIEQMIMELSFLLK